MLLQNIKNIIIDIKTAIQQSQDIDSLESIRIKYLGKKGYFSKQILELKKLSSTERLTFGKAINEAKKQISMLIIEHKILLEQIKLNDNISSKTLDITLPGRGIRSGSIHPISATITYIEYFFNSLGFEMVSGPEIEDNYHNFDALNIPIGHPSRTNHDTFWFNNTYLLRTQTSSVQIRVMKEREPPIRIITSGRVYRNDHDQTHTPMFHQIEGLFIDTNVSLAHLKGILNDFLNNFFEENIHIRFRPSYFPFTEPSAEVDILSKNNIWLEVLGCGMVHPQILCNVNINPTIYSGFAFGIGIERLTMLRYNINDARIFFENDLRFLKQFN